MAEGVAPLPPNPDLPPQGGQPVGDVGQQIDAMFGAVENAELDGFHAEQALGNAVDQAFDEIAPIVPPRNPALERLVARWTEADWFDGGKITDLGYSALHATPQGQFEVGRDRKEPLTSEGIDTAARDATTRLFFGDKYNAPNPGTQQPPEAGEQQ
jgi:hypothetical protein